MLPTLVVTALLASTFAPVNTPTTRAATADEISIYRAFLATYNNGSGTALNISDIADPFKLMEMDSECVRDFKGSGQDALKLDARVTEGEHATLVNRTIQNVEVDANDPGGAIRKGGNVDSAVNNGFAHALFWFSAIAFSKDGKSAAFTWGFHCGSLCGHGGTATFVKKGDAWVIVENRCGRWIS